MCRCSSQSINSHLYIYILELLSSNTKISLAPAAWRSSITFTILFLLTKLDTACPPSVSAVIVGERFPGVIFETSSKISALQLYVTMTNFLDVMYPSIRCFSKLTMSLCLESGLVIRIDYCMQERKKELQVEYSCPVCQLQKRYILPLMQITDAHLSVKNSCNNFQPSSLHCSSSLY